MKRAFLILCAGLLIIPGLFASGSKENDAMMSDDTMMSDDAMMEDDKMESDDDAMMSDDTKMTEEKAPEGDAMMMSAMAAKMEFTTHEDAVMYAETGPTVLLFLDKSEDSMNTEMMIKEQLGKIPPKVTILTVPNTASQVWEDYGVSASGTFVLIDAMGNAAEQWTGGDIDTFLMNTEKGM